MIKAENKPAFCIEHGTILNGGSGFDPSEFTVGGGFVIKKRPIQENRSTRYSYLVYVE
ncbi:hypothetical protein [Listeria ilorinensis]|uniref:hypothetical protein n=1 Tax=Listeria ilorinensis TaxID=2867439 RepID=UPI001EF5D2C2|nr:hypothetical protein [Listeria ilorinensis]